MCTTARRRNSTNVEWNGKSKSWESWIQASLKARVNLRLAASYSRQKSRSLRNSGQFENKTKDGNKYFGRDENFNSVIVESKENLTGQLLNVKINNFNHNSLFGETFEIKNRNYAA